MSANDSHEKRTTYPGREHEKAADCRRGHGRRRTVEEACRVIAVSVATYQRWKSQYSGVKEDALKRLRELEKENIRLD